MIIYFILEPFTVTLSPSLLPLYLPPFLLLPLFLTSCVLYFYLSFSSSPGLMDYVGEEYFRMRNYINKYERYILKVQNDNNNISIIALSLSLFLKELGFCVHVQHPHKVFKNVYLLFYLLTFTFIVLNILLTDT